MPVSLSIKNVPDDLLDRLRERARENHRSLQGELVSILEDAVQPRRLTLTEIHHRVGSLDLSTPSEATDIVRELRDGG